MKRKRLNLLLCFTLVLAISAPLMWAASPSISQEETTSLPTVLTDFSSELNDLGGTDPSYPTVDPDLSDDPQITDIPGATDERDRVEETGAPEESLDSVEEQDPSVVEALRETVMGFSSVTELEAFLLSLTDDERTLLLDNLTEADIRMLAEQCGVSLEESINTPASNYANVGALMPAVWVGASQRTLSRYDLLGSIPDNGLELSKNAILNGDGGYTITIEAYTTGTVTSSQISIPTDIVLVLDESDNMSGTMFNYEKVYNLNTSATYYARSGNSYVEVKWCAGGLFGSHSPGWYTGGHFLWHWGTRYEPMTSASDNTSGRVQFYVRNASGVPKITALKAAANQFVQNVYNDAQTNNVDHRIAVVGFSNNNAASIKIGLKNDIRTQKAAVDAAINGLKTSGNAYIEDGLTKAIEAFNTADQVPVAGQRNRVVIIFTAGLPGSGNWSSTNITNSANPAISAARTLKSASYGATVYAIGLLDGANPELPLDDGTSDDVRTNRFLHSLSSNYPNATSMTNAGSGDIGAGYYLSASDDASLSAIFQRITQEIATPAISLDASTAIIDVVTDYFTGPANVNDVKLYTSNYNGSSFGSRQSATGVQASVSGNTVSITGFNYDENFVSDTGRGTPRFYGRKLIIEFSVSPKPGFLGGNGVPTNEAISGVYKGGQQLAEAFIVPTVDVPLPAVSVTAVDKNVYLTKAMSDAELLVGAMSGAGTGAHAVPFTLSSGASQFALPSGADAWKADYVTLTTTVNRESGTTSATPLLSDSHYTVSVTLAPKATGGQMANTATSSPASAILVFKPELTFQDGDGWYGDAVPDFSSNLVSTVWKHGTLAATAFPDGQNMTGQAPLLTLTHAPREGSVVANTIATKKNIPVAVEAVRIGSLDISAYTTFVHQACASGCDWMEPQTPGDPAFLLHVKTAELTITKVGGASDEPSVFTVYKDGAKYTEATMIGNDSIVFYELPVGFYTVVEDAAWNWRYTTTSPTGVTLGASLPTGSLTSMNTPNGRIYWFNAFSNVRKNELARENP